MARHRILYNLCFICLVSSLFLSRPALATPVQDLTQIFGDPNQFVTNFKNSVTDKANDIVGLLIASTGFALVVRSLTG